MNHNSIENRLKRIETRICKLMEALDIDPYDSNTHHANDQHTHSGQGDSPEYEQPGHTTAASGDSEGAAGQDRRRSIFHGLLPSGRKG